MLAQPPTGSRTTAPSKPDALMVSGRWAERRGGRTVCPRKPGAPRPAVADGWRLPSAAAAGIPPQATLEARNLVVGNASVEPAA